MTELFLRIVNMSIAASWLVLAVMVLRQVFRKAPKWVSVLLWGIVAVRLLCPFSIESRLSLIPSTEIFPIHGEADVSTGIARGDEGAFADVGIDGSGVRIGEASKNDVNASVTTGAGTRQLTLSKLANLWVIGIDMMLLYTAISYLGLYRRIRTAVRLRGNIYQSEYVESPFVLGILRPRIYLPYRMDPQDLTHVIAHEQAHIRRRDHWWKPLGFVLLTIHWFNPFMWAAYILLCRDVELACDERVIRGLGREQRADYTQALVACSVRRRTIAACPLAFGEVGVKERVKSVMHYKKPAFWIVVLAMIACVAVAVCFLTDPQRDSFTIRIVVPAGSQEPFVYSHEEISPVRSQIVISSGEGLGDTEVVLQPVEGKQENVYEPTYLTPGLPVKMEAEKGGWFKIGVAMQNPTDQDIIVYVEVDHVEVRIAEMDGFASKALCVRIEEIDAGQSPEPKYNMFDITPFAGVTLPGVHTAVFSIEEVSEFVRITFETPLYQDGYETHGLQMKLGESLRLTTQKVGGTAYTFFFVDWSESEAYLTGADALRDTQNARKDLKDLQQELQKNKQENSKEDVEKRIAQLLDIIRSSPSTSSNPHDYIEAHSAEYQELLGYDEYTLRYCFSEFLKGDQTDLRGKIMENVCREISHRWGEAVLTADSTPLNGQQWFDTLVGNAKCLEQQYSSEELERMHPVSWLILELMAEAGGDVLSVMDYTVQEIGRGDWSAAVELSGEDAGALLQLLDGMDWNTQGTTDCSSDCAINLAGRLIYYHSGCGTFHERYLADTTTMSSQDIMPDGRSYSLTEAEQMAVNAILEKYITLNPSIEAY